MPDQTDQPASPFTELAAAAVQLHELFIAYQDAGFSETQALYLIGQMVRPQRDPS